MRASLSNGLLLLLLQFSRAEASELNGMVVPPYPIGITSHDGACVGNTEATICKRSIGLLETSAGRKFLIYGALDEAQHEKKARWRITDTLAFPSLKQNEILIYTNCQKVGHATATVLGVIHPDENQIWLHTTSWAYELDDVTGKFVKLTSKEVICAEEKE